MHLSNTRGSNNPRSKIDEALALKIFNDPRPRKLIAEDHGLSRESVGKIKNKKRWRHIHTD